jgi:hypothetical protein
MSSRFWIKASGWMLGQNVDSFLSVHHSYSAGGQLWAGCGLHVEQGEKAHPVGQRGGLEQELQGYSQWPRN